MNPSVKVTLPYLFEYLRMNEREKVKWDYIGKHCSPANPHSESRDVFINEHDYEVAMSMT